MSSLISEWKFSLVPRERARPKDFPGIQMIPSNLAEFILFLKEEKGGECAPWQSSALRFSALRNTYTPNYLILREFKWDFCWERCKSQTYFKPRKKVNIFKLTILQPTGSSSNLMLVACNGSAHRLGCCYPLLHTRCCLVAIQLLLCVALNCNHISSGFQAQSTSGCGGHLKYQWSL